MRQTRKITARPTGQHGLAQARSHQATKIKLVHPHQKTNQKGHRAGQVKVPTNDRARKAGDDQREVLATLSVVWTKTVTASCRKKRRQASSSHISIRWTAVATDWSIQRKWKPPENDSKAVAAARPVAGILNCTTLTCPRNRGSTPTCFSHSYARFA